MSCAQYIALLAERETEMANPDREEQLETGEKWKGRKSEKETRDVQGIVITCAAITTEKRRGERERHREKGRAGEDYTEREGERAERERTSARDMVDSNLRFSSTLLVFCWNFSINSSTGSSLSTQLDDNVNSARWT